MAKNMYFGVGGVARKVKQPYFGVGGVARKVKAGYIGVGGVARQFFAGGTPLSELEVGSTVSIKVDGTARNFIVVQQGKPSSAYDSSCDGTWLLQEGVYEGKNWDNTDNDYANSSIHSYLNGELLNMFDSNIANIIKQVKIPYTQGTGKNGSVSSGSSGLSTKVFLLSYTEVGLSGDSRCNVEGATIDYFDGASNSDRICYAKKTFSNTSIGNASYWWLRSPNITNTNRHMNIYTDGSIQSGNGINNIYGVRPAIILPSATMVDSNLNVVTS